MALISDYIHIKQRDVIIHSYPNFNGGLIKLHLDRRWYEGMDKQLYST